MAPLDHKWSLGHSLSNITAAGEWKKSTKKRDSLVTAQNFSIAHINTHCSLRRGDNGRKIKEGN